MSTVGIIWITSLVTMFILGYRKALEIDNEEHMWRLINWYKRK